MTWDAGAPVGGTLPLIDRTPDEVPSPLGTIRGRWEGLSMTLGLERAAVPGALAGACKEKSTQIKKE